MKNLTKIAPAICAAALALTALPAVSETKPSGAKPLSASAVQKLYAGKTHEWSKGGVYYASNGRLQQVWEKSIGFGTWRATKKGELCVKTFYLNGGQASPDKKSKGDNCNWHVQTSDGSIWINDMRRKTNAERKNEWWRIVKADGSSKRLMNGNKIGKSFARIYRKEGASQNAMAAVASMSPIKTKEDFISQVTGKKLYVTKKNVITYKPDGTYSGKWNGKPFSAKWQWKGTYFCRVLDGRTKEDCQVWQGNGTHFKATSDKGNGGFWHMSPRKEL